MGPTPQVECWLYQPEEPKKKHKWDYDEPGFVDVPKRKGPGTVRVAKCPSSMTMEQAEELLQGAIAWSPRGWTRDYPQRLYAVHDGWLYRAMPTIPGRSYHGFPEDDQSRQVPETLHEAIREVASSKGCVEEIERWLR
ncbi:MAG: hypothetical protein JKY37_02680 [Nannocystaceae bacterium]|nr:hypothetical protein [Nannocystaceae bacterium]